MGQRRGSRKGQAKGSEIKAGLAVATLLLVSMWLFPLWQSWQGGAGEELQGCSVERIVDGDTVQMSCTGLGSFRARLKGFDTPELHEPRCEEERAAAARATERLSELFAQARSSNFVHHGEDKYDRALVDARVDGNRVADIMVGEGHARRNWGDRRRGWCGPIGQFSMPDPISLWNRLIDGTE